MANGLYTIDCENGSYDPMIPTIRVPFHAILVLHLSLLLFYICFLLWQFIMDRRLASHIYDYLCFWDSCFSGEHSFHSVHATYKHIDEQGLAFVSGDFA